ncbi:MAG: type II CAAX endopeptidase family protein [Kiritimatiellia bacterium]|nr:type II CAAX endopeptidase family protein [Kiritimatiellia bacterium]
MTSRRFPAWPWLTPLTVTVFLLLFYSHRIWNYSFWLPLSAASGGCAAAALLFDPAARQRLRLDLSTGWLGKIGWGAGSAALVYGIFFVGNFLSRRLWPEAGRQIDLVYRVGDGASALSIALWITLMIAPAEEILWRGSIQHGLAERLGPGRAWILASALYALAHAPSLNPMLILAAAVCGGFWGALYQWKGSLTINIVSHIVWDLAVFLAFPFQR